MLDRGFRDRVRDVQDKSLTVFTPAFSYGRQTLTTEQANYSRLSTKIRYVVEVVNGHLKTKYRFLDHCIQNNILDQAHRIYKIVAAINNRFGNRIVSDVGRTSEVVQTFRDNLHRQNLSKDLVEAEGLVRRRSYYISLDSFDGIPYLSLKELRRIVGGSYQVSEAVNYYFDTLHRFGSPQNQRCVREIDFTIYKIDSYQKLRRKPVFWR